MLKYIRTLFPSWKFFTHVTPKPVIYYRYMSDSENFSNWTQLNLNSHNYIQLRNIKSLFHNPEENLYLATISQLEELLFEMNLNHKNVSELSTFKISEGFIIGLIKKLHPNTSQIEFKIITKQIQSFDSKKETGFQEEVQTLGEFFTCP